MKELTRGRIDIKVQQFVSSLDLPKAKQRLMSSLLKSRVMPDMVDWISAVTLF